MSGEAKKQLSLHARALVDTATSLASTQAERAALYDYVARLEAAVKRAVEDVNWMTNEEKLLNREVFKYLDELYEEFAPTPAG